MLKESFDALVEQMGSAVRTVYGDRLIEDVRAQLADLARISKRLRKEGEPAFYGDLDFIPTEECSYEDAYQAKLDARRVLQAAHRVIRG